ncbi:hypothetical protein HYX70_01545 [Candidatus Saccharibacteria bacterium]|nr:hypothetical protein [Candidatus Saccharibacteria bacterium]
MTGSQAYVIIALAIVGLVVFIVFEVYAGRVRRPRIAFEIQEAIEQLNAATRHHVQVQAVLALMDQFVEHPELMANLAEYSRQTVATALLNRVNTLGADLEVAQKALSSARQSYVRYPSFEQDVRRAEIWVEQLLLQLEDANQAAELFGGLHSV